MKLIGITGKAGAGKDTVADYLCARHAYRKVMFAGALKDALCAMLGWSQEQLDDREWKEAILPDIGKSPRQLMQTLGTEWGRELVNPDLWKIIARKRIEGFMLYRDVVVSDVRFDNEADMIREMGGTIIHLFRPGLAGVVEHKSEAGVRLVESVDWEVGNHGTIEDLVNTVEGLC